MFLYVLNTDLLEYLYYLDLDLSWKMQHHFFFSRVFHMYFQNER